MDGTYGRSAFQQQQNNLSSPITPSTPASGQYKTNINRTKTRKWVEAKTQNYDGDDWGADEYEDDADEPQEAAPPMPAPPPRIPSSSFAQQSAGPSPTTTSSFPSSAPGMSHGVKTPVGHDPLQIQTQHQQPSPTSVALPTSPETSSPFQSMAPASKISREPTPTRLGQTPPPMAAPVFQPPSAISSVHNAPASQSQSMARPPHQLPSQGQKDLPTQALSGPTSKPAGPRPWTEARSGSPVNAPAPATKAPTFIRPSDIYKRVEQEKERERQSLDSSRPSMDSAPGSHPLGYQDTSIAKTEPENVALSSRQGMGKSSVEPPVKAASRFYPTKDQPPSFSSAERAVGGGQGIAEEDEDNEDDIRRYSSSPKLPDLARMSTFGADFFSNPSSFTASDAPPMPSIPDIPEQAEKEVDSKLTSGSSLSKDTALDKSSALKSQDTAPLTKDVSASNALGLAPIASKEDTIEELTPSAEGKSLNPPKPKRPSVPGAWVSEISEASTAPEATPMAESVGTLGVGSSGLIREAAAATEPTAPAVPMSVPVTAPDASQVRDHGDEKIAPKTFVPVTTQKSDQAPRATSTALPPLKTGADIAPPTSDQKLDTTTTESKDPTKTQTMPAVSTPASAVSDIKPIPPLVPRAGISPQDFVPPPSIQRISTESTTHGSPAKESDKLRDEIIRTLSPVKPSQGFAEMTSREPEKLNEPAGRESTYLHDVYDDYWGDDDKEAEPDAPEVPKLPETIQGSDALPSQPEQQTVASTQQHQAPVAPPVIIPTTSDSIYPAVRPLSPRGTQQGLNEPVSASGHRRFSWEASTEQVAEVPAPSLPAGDGPSESEQKSPTAFSSQKPSSPPPSDSAIQSPTAGTSLLSPGPPKAQPAAESRPADVSHSISQASTLPPGAIAAIEPPSPLSVLSDHKPEPKMLVAEPRQPSIAEEKQTLASPISSATSPLQQQHPALMTETTSQNPASSMSSPTALSRPAGSNLNIMSFKQCMSPQIATERIDNLRETREKFATIDSGLDEWIRYMQLDPEHANATASLRDDIGVHQLLSPGAQGGQPGQQQTGGNLGIHGSQSIRLSGNAANFSHSTQQVGAKGKELLFTAGKLGKGLLSKGRSKLRQAGDKGYDGDDELYDSSPPFRPALLANTIETEAETKTSGSAKSDKASTNNKRDEVFSRKTARILRFWDESRNGARLPQSHPLHGTPDPVRGTTSGPVEIKISRTASRAEDQPQAVGNTAAAPGSQPRAPVQEEQRPAVADTQPGHKRREISSSSPFIEAASSSSGQHQDERHKPNDDGNSFRKSVSFSQFVDDFDLDEATWRHQHQRSSQFPAPLQARSSPHSQLPHVDDRTVSYHRAARRSTWSFFSSRSDGANKNSDVNSNLNPESTNNLTRDQSGLAQELQQSQPLQAELELQQHSHQHELDADGLILPPPVSDPFPFDLVSSSPSPSLSPSAPTTRPNQTQLQSEPAEAPAPAGPAGARKQEFPHPLRPQASADIPDAPDISLGAPSPKVLLPASSSSSIVSAKKQQHLLQEQQNQQPPPLAQPTRAIPVRAAGRGRFIEDLASSRTAARDDVTGRTGYDPRIVARASLSPGGVNQDGDRPPPVPPKDEHRFTSPNRRATAPVQAQAASQLTFYSNFSNRQVSGHTPSPSDGQLLAGQSNLARDPASAKSHQQPHRPGAHRSASLRSKVSFASQHGSTATSTKSKSKTHHKSFSVDLLRSRFLKMMNPQQQQMQGHPQQYQAYQGQQQHPGVPQGYGQQQPYGGGQLQPQPYNGLPSQQQPPAQRSDMPMIPPIRRTSTFDLGTFTKGKGKENSDGGSDIYDEHGEGSSQAGPSGQGNPQQPGAPSFAAFQRQSPQPQQMYSVPPQQQQQLPHPLGGNPNGPMQYQQQQQPGRPGPAGGPYQPVAQPMQMQQPQMMAPNGGMGGMPQGVQLNGQPQGMQGPPRMMSGPAPNQQQPMMGRGMQLQPQQPGGAPQQQFAQAQPGNPGMRPLGSPNMLQNGNPVQKLPPQRGWNLQESHLSEPLHTPSRNRSASNASETNYALDKETGVPSHPSSSPPPQSPQRQRAADAPGGAASPGRRPMGPPLSQHPALAGQPQPISNNPGMGPPSLPYGQKSLTRSQTHEIQHPGQDPTKNAGILSGIRQKLAGHAEGGRQSLDSQRVTGDGVSEMSQAPDGHKANRMSKLLGAIRHPNHGSHEPQQQLHQNGNGGAFGGPNPMGQPVQGHQMGPQPSASPQPQEKKGLSFGSISLGRNKGEESTPPKTMMGPPLSRTSTSNSNNQFGPPKKRFSNLKDMLARPSGHQQQPSQSQNDVMRPPETAHSMRSSMQGQPMSGSPSPSPAHGRRPSMQSMGPSGEERRPMTKLFSGILGKKGGKDEAKAEPPRIGPPMPQGRMMPPGPAQAGQSGPGPQIPGQPGQPPNGMMQMGRGMTLPGPQPGGPGGPGGQVMPQFFTAQGQPLTYQEVMKIVMAQQQQGLPGPQIIQGQPGQQPGQPGPASLAAQQFQQVPPGPQSPPLPTALAPPPQQKSPDAIRNAAASPTPATAQQQADVADAEPGFQQRKIQRMSTIPGSPDEPTPTLPASSPPQKSQPGFSPPGQAGQQLPPSQQGIGSSPLREPLERPQAPRETSSVYSVQTLVSAGKGQAIQPQLVALRKSSYSGNQQASGPTSPTNQSRFSREGQSSNVGSPTSPGAGASTGHPLAQRQSVNSQGSGSPSMQSPSSFAPSSVSQSTVPAPLAVRKPLGSTPSPTATRAEPPSRLESITPTPEGKQPEIEDQRASMASSVQSNQFLPHGSPDMHRSSIASEADTVAPVQLPPSVNTTPKNTQPGQFQPLRQQNSLGAPVTSPPVERPTSGQAQPIQNNAGGLLGQARQAAHSGQQGQPGPPAQFGQTGQPNQFGQPGQPGQFGQPGQPGHYRPSGPPGPAQQPGAAQTGTPQNQEPNPWLLPRPTRVNTSTTTATTTTTTVAGPQQGRPQQQTSQQPQLEHQGTFSKFFKSRLSSSPAPPATSEKPKDSSKSGGLFGALRRVSRQAETTTPSSQAPPGGPQYQGDSMPDWVRQHQLQQQIQQPQGQGQQPGAQRQTSFQGGAPLGGPQQQQQQRLGSLTGPAPQFQQQGPQGQRLHSLTGPAPQMQPGQPGQQLQRPQVGQQPSTGGPDGLRPVQTPQQQGPPQPSPQGSAQSQGASQGIPPAALTGAQAAAAAQRTSVGPQPAAQEASKGPEGGAPLNAGGAPIQPNAQIQNGTQAPQAQGRPQGQPQGPPQEQQQGYGRPAMQSAPSGSVQAVPQVQGAPQGAPQGQFQQGQPQGQYQGQPQGYPGPGQQPAPQAMQQQGPPQAQKPPQRAPTTGFGLRSAKPAQRNAEPQYDAVPIPQGYSTVHGEGMVAPSPYGVASPSYQYYGQPPMNQAQQHWAQAAQAHPAMAQRQMQMGPSPPPGANGHQMLPSQLGQRLTAAANAYGQMPQQGPGQQLGQPPAQGQPQTQAPQQVGQQPLQQISQQAPQQAQQVPQQVPQQPTLQSQVSQPDSRQTSLSSAPQGTPGVSPLSNRSPPPATMNATSLQSHEIRPQQPDHIETSVNKFANNNREVAPQSAGSAQGYPLPQTAFSPINPAARDMPNPALPPQPQGHQIQSFAVHNDDGPHRQPSTVSQVSNMSNASPPAQTGPFQGPAGVNVTNTRTPSPQLTHRQQPQQMMPPQRNASPLPAAQKQAPAPVNVNSDLAPAPLKIQSPVQSQSPPPLGQPQGSYSTVRAASPPQNQQQPPREQTPPVPSKDQAHSNAAIQLLQRAQQQQQQQARATNVNPEPPMRSVYPTADAGSNRLSMNRSADEPKPRTAAPPVFSEPVISEPVVSEPVVSPPVVSPPVISPPQTTSPPVNIKTTEVVTPPAANDTPEPPSPIEGDDELAPLDKGKLAVPAEETNGGDLGRKGTIRATSAQQFEEAKRKMLLRDMEEKIPVFDGPTVEETPVEKKDEAAPMMSATSYPGQEWNPYEFAYEEDD